MTEKIKAKNADAICALVNGETVQGRSLNNHIDDSYYWKNYILQEKCMIVVYADRLEDIDLDFKILFDENWEFRIKHPHQDLIDQIEADPLLEQYLQIELPIPFTLHKYWGDAKLIYLKDTEYIKNKFRINKPAHPHQKLIDLHKANPDWIVQFQEYDESNWGTTNDPSWKHNWKYRLISQQIMAESKGGAR